MIREATLDDTKWIIHHRKHMLHDIGVKQEIAQEAADFYIPFLEQDWTLLFRYYLIVENDEVVGGCGLSIRQLVPTRFSPSGKNAYIWNMYVEPEYRRKGFGRSLVRHIIELCKLEEIGLIELHASEIGKPLYASEGFENWEGYMALLTLKP